MGEILINNAERQALIATARGLDQNQLDALIYSALGLNIGEFGSITDNMVVLSSKFVSWVTKRGDLFTVVDQIIEDYPNHEKIAILRSLSQRLSAARKVVLPQSFDAVLIDTATIANRAPLRATLRQLITSSMTRPVVIVSGTEKSGRSHSWHLIRHVAEDHGIAVRRIDLEKWVTEERTLDALFDDVRAALDILDSGRPPSQGVTPQTLGQLYAERIDEYHQRSVAVARWIVFDSTDRAIAQEIAAFLRRICELRLEANLLKCTFFLLGDGSQLSFDENAHPVSKERLSRILPHEVDAAAKEINALGAKRLNDAELASKVAEINGKLNACSDSECGKTVAEALRALRLKVEAP